MKTKQQEKNTFEIQYIPCVHKYNVQKNVNSYDTDLRLNYKYFFLVYRRKF